ncbi:MAG: hypothetical protein NVS4B3_12630 [Gemmatimonadaceae bacterium]
MRAVDEWDAAARRERALRLSDDGRRPWRVLCNRGTRRRYVHFRRDDCALERGDDSGGRGETPWRGGAGEHAAQTAVRCMRPRTGRTAM